MLVALVVFLDPLIVMIVMIIAVSDCIYQQLSIDVIDSLVS